jgi:hypothetical protein
MGDNNAATLQVSLVVPVSIDPRDFLARVKEEGVLDEWRRAGVRPTFRTNSATGEAVMVLTGPVGAIASIAVEVAGYHDPCECPACVFERATSETDALLRASGVPVWRGGVAEG